MVREPGIVMLSFAPLVYFLNLHKIALRALPNFVQPTSKNHNHISIIYCAKFISTLILVQICTSTDIVHFSLFLAKTQNSHSEFHHFLFQSSKFDFCYFNPLNFNFFSIKSSVNNLLVFAIILPKQCCFYQLFNLLFIY